MKLNVVTSGLDTLRLGPKVGGRSLPEIRKDIADLNELIVVNHLGRDLSLENEILQAEYEKIFDGKLVV